MSQTVSKKFLRSVDTCVDDNLLGYVKLHTGVKLLKKHSAVIRDDLESIKRDGRVTILSGGGAGHEPFAAGFVGRGMLTGAVSGAIFTSPTSANILATVRLLATGNSGGLLMLVANYTGDRLTFGQALERARLEGLRVEMIVVAEDCALSAVSKSVGRRGLCGMIFMQKLAGAMAESGHSLPDIVDHLNRAAKKMGTMGVCQSSCSLPGAGALFQLGADELELGLGIHGEVGVKRIKVRSSEAIVEMMIRHMTNTESTSHVELKRGDCVAVLVNNLGSLTHIEMNIVAHDVFTLLTQVMELKVERCYVGTLQTSLDMGGFSISIMHVTPSLLRYLDAPTTAPAWLQVGSGLVTNDSLLFVDPMAVEETSFAVPASTAKLNRHETDLLQNCIIRGCEVLILNEAKLNALDSGCGDGDCGTTLKKGAKAVLYLIESDLDWSCPMDIFLRIGSAVSESMGGCSGGLLSIFFTSASGALSNRLTTIDWCNALEIDPLAAAYQILRAQLEVGSRPLAALTESVAEAREVCKQTAGMKAKAGRASYVGSDFLGQPDAGATAVVLILDAILEIVKAG
uniref:Triokinase/FMN cyclase n=1 Tax=Strigamia maritima TaxID=126957 RepID=T1IL93_STRMM